MDVEGLFVFEVRGDIRCMEKVLCGLAPRESEEGGENELDRTGKRNSSGVDCSEDGDDDSAGEEKGVAGEMVDDVGILGEE